MEAPTLHKVRSVRPGNPAVFAELSGTQDGGTSRPCSRAPAAGAADVLAAAETVLVTADSPASAGASGPAAGAHQRRRTRTANWCSSTPATARISPRRAAHRPWTRRRDRCHTGQVWTVAFAGFAPGFGYMVGEDQVLEVPRRSSPGTAVPAGSVALAGTIRPVYPRRSPGGGGCSPAAPAPGCGPGTRTGRPWPPPGTRRGPRRPGGCHGWRRYSLPRTALPRCSPGGGVRPADCFTRPAEPDPGPRPLRPLGAGRLRGRCAGPRLAARANRLVGNARSAAAVETVAGGLSVQAVGDQVLAVTGRPRSSPSKYAVQQAVLADRPHGHPLRAARRRNPGHRGTAEPASRLPRRPRRRGHRPGAGPAPRAPCPGSGPAPLAAGQLLAAGGEAQSGVVGTPRTEAAIFPDTGVTVLDVVPGPGEPG